MFFLPLFLIPCYLYPKRFFLILLQKLTTSLPPYIIRILIVFVLREFPEHRLFFYLISVPMLPLLAKRWRVSLVYMHFSDKRLFSWIFQLLPNIYENVLYFLILSFLRCIERISIAPTQCYQPVFIEIRQQKQGFWRHCLRSRMRWKFEFHHNSCSWKSFKVPLRSLRF